MLWKVLKVKMKGLLFHAGPGLPTNSVPRTYGLIYGFAIQPRNESLISKPGFPLTVNFSIKQLLLLRYISQQPSKNPVL